MYRSAANLVMLLFEAADMSVRAGEKDAKEDSYGRGGEVVKEMEDGEKQTR